MASEPKYRGLIFAGELIPGVMSGAVTVTSRMTGLKRINERPDDWEFCHEDDLCFCHFLNRIDPHVSLTIRCPYFVGERRYVKEACTRGKLPHILTGEPTEFETAVYAVDGQPCLTHNGFDLCPWWPGRSSSAMMMPRWAARTWIEITGVRPARCQEITEEEVRASMGGLLPRAAFGLDVIAAYAALWDRLNRARGFPWAANAWVWRCAFRLAKEES